MILTKKKYTLNKVRDKEDKSENIAFRLKEEIVISFCESYNRRKQVKILNIYRDIFLKFRLFKHSA